MNLNKFSLISEAKDSYHVKSPSGKAFTVNKKGLSDKAHSLIKNLKKGSQTFYDGGDVEIKDPKEEQKLQNNKTDNVILNNPSSNQELQKIKQDLIEPEDFFNGGPANLPDSGDGSSGNTGGNIEKIQELAESLPSPGMDVPAAQEATNDITNSSNTNDSINDTDSSDTAITPTIANTNIDNSSVSTGSTTTPASVPDDFNKDLKQANSNLGKAEGAVSNAKAAGLQEGINKFNSLPTAQDVSAKHAVDIQKYADAIDKGKINPTAAWDNMDTGNKIKTAIGVMLHSGLGQMFNTIATGVIPGLTDRDIAAQKANQDTNVNLYKLNREASNSDVEAALRTRAQQLEMIQYYANQKAAEMGGKVPTAVQNQINATLDQNRKMLQWKLSELSPTSDNNGTNIANTEQGNLNHIKRLQAIGTSQNDPTFKDAAKELQLRTIPGEGTVPTGPVPGSADITKLTNYKDMENALQDALAFQTSGPGGNIGAWSPQNRSAAEAIMGHLRVAAAPLTFEMKRGGGDIGNQFLSAMKNPGSFDLFDSNKANIGQTLKFIKGLHKNQTNGMGIQPFTKAPVDQTAINWARQNPSNPLSIKILNKNGLVQ